MKQLVIFLALIAGVANAHDEGHGPKLNDSPKQGGKLAPVIAANEVSRGERAQLIYKAELVRSEDDSVKLYLYDKEMYPLSQAQLTEFGKTAQATIEHVKKGKIAKTSKFSLDLQNGVFEGKLGERPKTQTFNVDVKMKKGETDLLAAFDGLETKMQ